MMLTISLSEEEVKLAIIKYLLNEGLLEKAINPDLVNINIETHYEDRSNASYPRFKDATITIPKQII